MVLALVAAARNLTTRFFYRFGLHCAKYTIRVLIISGLVITGLVYPAIAIQLYSQPLSLFSTRLKDAWLLYRPGNNDLYLHPVRDIWEGHETLRIRDDPTALAQCGGGDRVVSLERLFVRGDPYDPLTGPTLLAALNLYNHLQSTLRSRATHISCIKSKSGSCYTLTPFIPWTAEEVPSLTDVQFLTGLNIPMNLDGVPIHPDSVVSGHSPGEEIVSDPQYLVFTYFFEGRDCQSSIIHHAWLQAVLDASVSSEAHIYQSLSPPRLLALEHSVEGHSSRISVVSALLYLTYVLVFVHFSGSLRRMETVHSRYGLAFTGIVEIIASTMCSISVCAIVGYRITMVPWGMLPIVIVFVGAENMFNLVEQVVSTAITLPVKERIAIGLSRAGSSNTLKVLTYNIVLGSIAFFAQGAIRQFCIFAIVVLVAHWFLVHTMFIAVLAVDLHRLELNDLLRQNSTLNPSASPPALKSSPAKVKNSRSVSSKLQNVLRGRAATNSSLLLMLAVTCALYYTTYSFPNKDDFETRLSNRYLHSPNTSFHPISSPNMDTPAGRIWRLLNPDEEKLLHLRIESPTFVTFTSNGRTSIPDRRPSRLAFLLMPLFHVTKIIIAPIVITNFLLYLLINYLMKDADLVEAQRHREEGDGSSHRPTPPIARNITFTQLARACAHDIALVASSDDASVIASISIENELAIWFGRDGSHINVDCTAVLARGTFRAVVTTLAVDHAGTYCAVGTDSGSVAIWSFGTGVAVLQCRTHRPEVFPVKGLTFIIRPIPKGSGYSRSTNRKDLHTGLTPSLVVVSGDGSIFDWTFLSSDHPVQCRDPHSNLDLSVAVMPTPTNHEAILAILHPYNSVQVLSSSPDAVRWEWRTVSAFQPGDENHPIVYMCLERLPVGGDEIPFLVSATDLGHVLLNNANSGETIADVYDVQGTIDQVRLTSTPSKRCPSCDEMKGPSLTLALSASEVIHVYNIPYPTDGTICACPRVDLLDRAYGDRIRSRRPSTVSSQAPSPARSRPRVLPPQDWVSTTKSTTKYPMYGHGVLSKRDKLRHGGSETEYVTPEQPPQKMFPVPLPAAASISLPSPGDPQKGKRIFKVAEINCDRGSWDICGGLVVGVRRRARTPAGKLEGSPIKSRKPKAPLGRKGLPPIVLEKWELWTADDFGAIQASPLSDLPFEKDASKPSLSRSSSQSNLFFHLPIPPTSPDFTNSVSSHGNPPIFPRIPFTRISHFFATSTTDSIVGFGNTVSLFHIPFPREPRLSTNRSPSISSLLSPPPRLSRNTL